MATAQPLPLVMVLVLIFLLLSPSSLTNKSCSLRKIRLQSNHFPNGYGPTRSFTNTKRIRFNSLHRRRRHVHTALQTVRPRTGGHPPRPRNQQAPARLTMTQTRFRLPPPNVACCCPCAACRRKGHTHRDTLFLDVEKELEAAEGAPSQGNGDATVMVP